MAIRGFGIRIDERWIGVSMINVAQFTARLAPDQRKPLVYLEFIETAPDCWPKKITGVGPEFGGCGVQMLRQVVFESLDEGFHGRVGLHSLDQSRSFYERHGMTFIEVDAKKENLLYYEFTKETAAAFLRGGNKISIIRRIDIELIKIGYFQTLSSRQPRDASVFTAALRVGLKIAEV